MKYIAWTFFIVISSNTFSESFLMMMNILPNDTGGIILSIVWACTITLCFWVMVKVVIDNIFRP